MEQNELAAFSELQARLADSQKNTAMLQQSSSLFDKEERGNLMQEILNPDKILLRIERFLKQQKPVLNPENQTVIYVDTPKEERILNDHGVHKIMGILSWYINPDIILSNYNDEEVETIMKQFSIELIDNIFTHMEEYGMNNKEKQKDYDLLCMNIINIVDATYHRSIGGKALDALNKSVMVSQTEPLGNNLIFPKQQKNFKLLKPSTWV